ncbi:hypothetical protein Nepgr_022683 [Nepenthes gracilis]|uniref:Gnk2-homologous domain-containing protein n=1 Tax=Nepenthes gracilis TaxID=150966 RepID=A0AAD3T318_NEPGR|nr:hypothetical protein Nepgr_022683 [Nepenthes gracilis]
MASVPLLLLTLFITCCLADDPLGNYCNSDISSSSPIAKNIDHVLLDLVREIEHNFFAATSYGQGESSVYGLAQCRGDVDSNDCLSCVRNASVQIKQLCSGQVDSRIWYDFCFLRYSNDNFYGKLDTSYGILYKNVEDVTDPDSFNKALGALFDRIDSEATKPENQGLGKAKTKLSPFVTLYGLVQCTRDISELDCAQCLATAIENFQGFCSNKKGCRVLYSSCYVRYELYPFFFPLESETDLTKTIKATLHA